ncbi:MAG: glutamate 5-kinase [Candidatus Omnitrophica bacterium]|nr:glutamate 5-kinase [Candidatus Omnitrophota bacterium]
MSEPPHTIHRLVVKVGSSVLTDERGRLLPERIGQLAQQVASCAAANRQPIVVSSGAIACGMSSLGLAARPKPLAQLQACAAIGQGELMRLYTQAFGGRGVLTAQVLLTQEDLSDRARFRNAKQTLLTLLHRRVVPIVNENDTVAVEEITFGDNDRLAALVAVAVDAQLLVALSDVDGVLQDGKVLERVDLSTQGDSPAWRGRWRADASQRGAAPGERVLDHGGKRQTTKGGMSSKLDAARIAGHSGIPMVIANGTRPGVLEDVLAGKPVGTLCVPPRTRLASRKWWIAFSLRQPKGTLVVDAGAAEALLEKGKSLLASGVQNVQGEFGAGEFVTLTDGAGHELARGVCNFSSSELARVRGMKSAEIAKVLGRTRVPEVVHRDDLVLARDYRAGRR